MTNSREIAGKLDPSKWKAIHEGDAYRNPQTRFRVAIERNSGIKILSHVDEDRDPEADADQFAEDLVGAMEQELSPRDMEALLKAIGKRYIAWGKSTTRTNAMDAVYETIEGLLETATAR